jgi:hypothetical protein
MRPAARSWSTDHEDPAASDDGPDLRTAERRSERRSRFRSWRHRLDRERPFESEQPLDCEQGSIRNVPERGPAPHREHVPERGLGGRFGDAGSGPDQHNAPPGRDRISAHAARQRRRPKCPRAFRSQYRGRSPLARCTDRTRTGSAAPRSRQRGRAAQGSECSGACRSDPPTGSSRAGSASGRG